MRGGVGEGSQGVVRLRQRAAQRCQQFRIVRLNAGKTCTIHPCQQADVVAVDLLDLAHCARPNQIRPGRREKLQRLRLHVEYIQSLPGVSDFQNVPAEAEVLIALAGQRLGLRAHAVILPGDAGGIFEGKAGRSLDQRSHGTSSVPRCAGVY